MSGKPSGANRRTSERIETHHHVVFSDYRALGPLRTGTAVDRSSGGMRIITPHPEPLGTTLQIELRASPDSASVLLLEGRVVHITPAEKGQHAMGIRLIAPTLRAGTPLPTRERRVVTTPVATAAAKSIKTPAPVAAPVGMPPDMDMSEAVTFRRIEDGGRPGSWLALLGILALVVILILLIVEALRQDQRMSALDFFNGWKLPSIFTKKAPEETPAESSPAGAPASNAAEQDALKLTPADVPSVDGNAGSPALEAVDPAVGEVVALDDASDAAIAAGAPPELRGSAPLSPSGFAAMLEYADRAASRGETGLAQTVVRRAMARGGNLPAAWRSLGDEYGAQLARAGEIAPAQQLNTEVSLETPASASGAASEIRLDVDIGDHMMRVWRGDKMLSEFPVGLGRNGATPQGEFRIGVKARRPDWYHEGRVVPAGDPGNPIGDQWLALQQNGARTGVGIHPTQHPESIGGNQSLGCVRMRPEDAETLYRLVPVGATVTIHP